MTAALAAAKDKGRDNTQTILLSSLTDPNFTLPCPYTACISSLPPVKQMSGCSNLHLLNGIEAGHGTAEQLLPERPRDKFAPSVPFYLHTSSIQLSLFLVLHVLVAFCLSPSFSRGMCVVTYSAVSWAFW